MNSIHGYMIYDIWFIRRDHLLFQVVPRAGRTWRTQTRPGLFLAATCKPRRRKWWKGRGAENILRNFQSQKKEAVCETTLIPLKPLKWWCIFSIYPQSPKPKFCPLVGLGILYMDHPKPTSHFVWLAKLAGLPGCHVGRASFQLPTRPLAGPWKLPVMLRWHQEMWKATTCCAERCPGVLFLWEKMERN